MIVLIWLAAIIAAVAFYFRQLYSRFRNHGVKSLAPLPLVGNMGPILFRKEHFSDNMDKLYYAYPGERFVGRFEFLAPMIVLKDLELIKKILVKDFENFVDRRMEVSGKNPSIERGLFFLKGDDWKDMRSTLSPAFTSSKIRLMVPFMLEIGDQMISSVKRKIQSTGANYIDLDAKDLTSRSTNDVIASCAFGLKVDSHTDQDNEFYVQGKKSTSFSYKHLLMFIGNISFPWLMRLLGVAKAGNETTDFFKGLVLNTMRDREERQVIRPDMIHLLLEAKKGKLTHSDKADTDAGFATVQESAVGKREVNRVWSDDELVAQARLFFIAGYETVSSVMSFLVHELAINPDVQEKLVQEFRDYDAKNGGKFDYSAIQHMTYLDMVISELLRLWPPVVTLDRQANKDYNLGKPNSKSTKDYILRKGENVGIPVWTIHRDPEYYPNPLKFDPERFSEQNKHNVKQFSYMPFGLGPRNCIGSRFALCEVKVMIYLLLRSIKISASPKTQNPAKLTPDPFNMRIQGGHSIRCEVRQ